MPRRRETDSVMEQPSQEEAGFAAPSTQTASAPQAEPTTQQIAQRAYEIYQARGGTEGQDIEDWLQAERELRRGLQPQE